MTTVVFPFCKFLSMICFLGTKQTLTANTREGSA